MYVHHRQDRQLFYFNNIDGYLSSSSSPCASSSILWKILLTVSLYISAAFSQPPSLTLISTSPMSWPYTFRNVTCVCRKIHRAYHFVRRYVANRGYIYWCTEHAHVSQCMPRPRDVIHSWGPVVWHRKGCTVFYVLHHHPCSIVAPFVYLLLW